MPETSGPYRILWHTAEMFSARRYASVTEAVAAAERIQRAYVQKPAPTYDIAWAGSGRIIPDWYRQMCLELGK